MTALSADRAIVEHMSNDWNAGVAASTTIYLGSLIMEDASGYAVPGAATSTLRALGVALEQVDNSAGSAGDETVNYRKGIFGFINSSGGDEITIADIGEVCYVVDDQTVAATSDSGNRPIAGRIMGIDQNSLVMVLVGYTTTVDGDLVAANNLSDVAAAATARANIGANEIVVGPFRVPLDAAGVYYFQSPVAGDITSIRTVLTGALTGGDPTITADIETTAITDGVVTIAASGSAARDEDVATPSALNTVAAGDTVGFTIADNSQTNSEYADVCFLIET